MSMIEQLGINTVILSSRLRYQQIEPDITAFEMTSSAELAERVGDLKINLQALMPNTASKGYVNDRNLKLLKQGKAYKTLQFWQLDQTARELIRTDGWRAWEKLEHPTSIDIFDAVKDPDCLVRVDYSSHMLFDRHGDALPVAIHFDYISYGGITEGRYDLNKLAAHLLSRDDIWIYPRQSEWRDDDCDRDSRATKLDECIVRIPYYNSERGASQTIYFRWMPSVDTYRKMWQHCLKSKSKYPSTYMHQAIFELDLIGARAAGCALFDEYHKSTRYDNCGND